MYYVERLVQITITMDAYIEDCVIKYNELSYSFEKIKMEMKNYHV